MQTLIVSRTKPRVQTIIRLAESLNISVRFETHEILTSLVDNKHHQGVALYVEGEPYIPLESFLQRSLSQIDPLVVLDSIHDPQNLGALLRSACFLGAKGVVIPKDRAAGISSTVIKVAAGAVSYLPVIRVTNLVRSLEQLREKGLWLAGLDLQAHETLYELDLSAPLAIVIGNEQKGIRPLVRRKCDFLARIPSSGPLQSLNAATAGAIALAEVQRRRLSCDTRNRSIIGNDS
jgi:23S rRNA (guanosine2251-2'-O)-methyltransferase